MKVTVEKVSNGYIVTTDDGRVFVASTLSGYSGVTLQEIMRQIFNKEDKE